MSQRQIDEITGVETIRHAGGCTYESAMQAKAGETPLAAPHPSARLTP